MWTKLENIYEMKSETSIYHLQQKYYDFVKEPQDDMAVSISKLQSIVQQLKDLGENISESMVITKIMMTLPPALSHFYSAWESTAADQKTIKNLTQRLLMEEARLQNQERVDSNALAAKFIKGKPNSSGRKPGQCHNCGEHGHWARDCRKGNSTSSRRSSNSAYRRGSALIGQAMTVIWVNKKTNEWILDSGASDHMSHNRDWFCNYEKFDKIIPVRIGNGKTIPALGCGDIQIQVFDGTTWQKKFLENVLYVPDIHVNLFSTVCALDKDFTLTANKRRCELLLDGKVMVIGLRENQLFKLQLKVIINQKQSNFHQTGKRSNVLRLWHERLGHQHIRQIKNVLKTFGVDFKNDSDFFCEACVMGKHHRTPFENSNSQADRVGELVHTDVCGMMQEQSLGGAKYFLLFKDDFSHYRTVFFIKNKSEVPELTKKYINSTKSRTGSSILVLRSDNGGEYINKRMEILLEAHGITHQTTVPYTPEQNGRAEREIRTIVEAARTLIHSKNLPLKLWAEAVNTVVYVLNRTGPSPVANKTPFELWFGKKASINHLKVFGSEAYVHVQKEKRKKWNSKAKKWILVGYCDNTKGYRVWINENNVEISRDVKFRETTSTESNNYDTENTNNSLMLGHDTDEGEISEIQPISNQTVIGEEIVDLTRSTNSSRSNESRTTNNSNNSESSETSNGSDQTWILNEDDVFDSTRDSLNAAAESLRQTRFSTLEEAIMQGHAYLSECHEPSSYENALKSQESEKWSKAINEEYASLMENQTWKLVQPPKNRKIIRNKWTFKIKENSAGQTIRYKARLVACGYSQVHGIDYDETFSPVVKYTSIRVILAVATSFNLKLRQFDVKTAFLHGDLQEEIYMSQPKGFDDQSGRVCKLLKTIYGLKQSSRCWNKKFTELIQQFNLRSSKADDCVFTFITNERKIILAIWIDDGLVAASNSDDIEKLISGLQSAVEIKSSEANFFVGLEINQKANGSIHLNQKGYTRKMLAKFNMTDANPVATPSDSNFLNFGTQKEITNVKFPYREAIGSLMYLAVATRPDIAHAIGILSRSLSNPTENHVTGVKRVFKYLKGTMDYGIYFKKNEKLSLNVYSDADYAGDPSTRKSTSGYLCMIGSATVSWCSQRQKCVSVSSTESEYVAASEATKEIIWLVRRMEVFSTTTERPKLHIDNQGAIKLVKNNEFHKRTKHIDVMHHFIRQKYEEGFFNVTYVNTKDQIADLLTKPLPKQQFQRLRSLMGLSSETSSTP